MDLGFRWRSIRDLGLVLGFRVQGLGSRFKKFRVGTTV